MTVADRSADARQDGHDHPGCRADAGVFVPPCRGNGAFGGLGASGGRLIGPPSRPVTCADQGVSRAELIRQLIDASLGAPGAADLDADLAAIRESFGVLRDEEIPLGRGPDDRARHLDRMVGR